MKFRLTKEPAPSDRYRVRRAWLPRVVSDGSQTYLIWLRRYIAHEIYLAAHEISMTGLPWTPGGWVIKNAILFPTFKK